MEILVRTSKKGYQDSFILTQIGYNHDELSSDNPPVKVNVPVCITSKNTPSTAVEYNFWRLLSKNGSRMKSLIPASLVVIGHSIVDWWDGWIIMILMTILWFLCQITVILGPPATFGLYYAVYEMLEGVPVGVPEMIQAGRKYFKQAWIWGAFNLIVLFTIMTAFRFYTSIQTWWGISLQILVIILAFLCLSSNFYGLPYFMEIDPKSLRVALRNGLYTTLAAPFFTLILFVLTVLILGLSLLLILPIFLGIPALIPILGFHALANRIEAFGLGKAEPLPKEIDVEHNPQSSGQKSNFDQPTSQEDKDY